MNWIIILAAALVPVFVGIIWYSPFIFGKTWMDAANLTPERLKGMNRPMLMLWTFIFGLFISLALMPMVIHQMHLNSFLMGTPGLGEAGSEVQVMVDGIMEKYGKNYRSFKHGALHGVIAALFFAMPVVGMSALFERRGLKYIIIHTGFWIISLAIMGGLICGFM